MNTLPSFIILVFILTSFISVYLFYIASGRKKTLLLVIIGWMILHAMLARSGFYLETGTIPPRMTLALLPPLLAIIFLFNSKNGRLFIDKFNIKTVTLIHLIRIPVEMVLFWLFLHKLMPQLMTFEGRNADMISGITAPIVYYFAFVKRKMGNRLLMVWNIVCLAILTFTVVNAILSLPCPLQKFAFDQPVVAVLYFPFIWLPAVVVPVVYFSHLVTIRQLWLMEKERTGSVKLVTA